MSNLPPGVTPGDIDRAMDGPDPHDHEFRLTDDSPHFEDAAAIFIEVCRHQRTRSHADYDRDEVYHEPMGPECDEDRSYRFEARTLTVDGTNSDVPGDPADWAETLEDHLEELMIAAADETADRVNIDPDPDTGEVVIENGDVTVRFEP